jgi:hypothetical protein
MPRRERCHLVGRRAKGLSPIQSAAAWAFLAGYVEALDSRDVPKFNDLMAGIRSATIHAIKVYPCAAPKIS